jgi:hypothetical protein
VHFDDLMKNKFSWEEEGQWVGVGWRKRGATDSDDGRFTF